MAGQVGDVFGTEVSNVYTAFCGVNDWLTIGAFSDGGDVAVGRGVGLLVRAVEQSY